MKRDADSHIVDIQLSDFDGSFAPKKVEGNVCRIIEEKIEKRDEENGTEDGTEGEDEGEREEAEDKSAGGSEEALEGEVSVLIIDEVDEVDGKKRQQDMNTYAAKKTVAQGKLTEK